MEREDWAEAFGALEQAINLGVTWPVARAKAALAAAKTANLSNFNEISIKVALYIQQLVENGSAPAKDVAAFIEEVESHMAAQTLRVIEHFVNDGDKAYFAYESSDRRYAASMRDAQYANAVSCADFSLRYPPSDKSTRIALATAVLHRSRISANPAYSIQFEKARGLLRSEGGDFSAFKGPANASKLSGVISLAGAIFGGLIGLVCGVIASVIALLALPRSVQGLGLLLTLVFCVIGAWAGSALAKRKFASGFTPSPK